MKRASAARPASSMFTKPVTLAGAPPRIGDRARHRTEGSLVQDHIGRPARDAASIRVGDVALDEAVAFPCLFANQGLDLEQLVRLPGGEIVQAHHALAMAQQRFQQMRPGEARAAGHNPVELLRRQGAQRGFMVAMGGCPARACCAHDH